MGKIEHVLVLMMENRSFDHMLGYLQYPAEAHFEGVRGREQEFGNPLAGGEVVFPGPEAGYTVHPGPGHSHDDVMQQLLGSNPRSRPYQLTNNGFAANYDEQMNPGHGRVAVQCFAPDCLPVMATLAKEFAVADHWFCSVPGATWPNRNFAHTATSDGQVNIQVRAYHNHTIFEQLSDAGRDWAVYYGGFPPQSLAFSHLWLRAERNWLQRYKPIRQLYRAIKHDRLPHYAFIEPDMMGRVSDSQHPGMGGEMDFKAGEHLMWQIYSALRDNRQVFDKTLFVIVYDEHGGFFDHVPPPQGPEWQVDEVFRAEDGTVVFPFDLLGLRVPAILISPWIARGTVDHTVYDHASIPATVRKLLDVAAPPLTNRDAVTNTFERCLSLDQPRTGLPDLPEPRVDQETRALIEEPNLRPSLMRVLTELVWNELRRQAVNLAQGGAPGSLALAGPDSPADVERVIMAKIAPRLSDPAQHVLEEDAAAGGGRPGGDGLGADTALGVSPVISMLRHKVEQLAENLSLVDDLGKFVDLVLREFFEGHQIVLRTAAGESREQPDTSLLRQELEALRAQPGSGGQVWLADHRDRWLTFHADGRVTLHDQGPDRVRSLAQVSVDRAVGLFLLFKNAKIRDLRREFAR